MHICLLNDHARMLLVFAARHMGKFGTGLIYVAVCWTRHAQTWLPASCTSSNPLPTKHTHSALTSPAVAWVSYCCRRTSQAAASCQARSTQRSVKLSPWSQHRHEEAHVQHAMQPWLQLL
jgi:hypothetical protein